MLDSYLNKLKIFNRIKSVFKWWKTSNFILSPCYLHINLHPMFTLRYRKSRDNLSSSDVTLSSRMYFWLNQWESMKTWGWRSTRGGLNPHLLTNQTLLLLCFMLLLLQTWIHWLRPTQICCYLLVVKEIRQKLLVIANAAPPERLQKWNVT